MVAKLSEPTIITEADIDPGHNWKKALAAPGVMAVDFEERINFRRLHRYRLARTRQALKNSELGALLCFDANNIRYMTSTNIGEWSRDKMCRSSLLAGEALPHQWDFGSAAAHHRLQDRANIGKVLLVTEDFAARGAEGVRVHSPQEDPVS